MAWRANNIILYLLVEAGLFVSLVQIFSLYKLKGVFCSRKGFSLQLNPSLCTLRMSVEIYSDGTLSNLPI